MVREGKCHKKDLRKLHKSPFVVVLNTTLCSLDVNIDQRVQFVASQFSIFAALPRAMNRNNAKLSEGMNSLF